MNGCDLEWLMKVETVVMTAHGLWTVENTDSVAIVLPRANATEGFQHCPVLVSLLHWGWWDTVTNDEVLSWMNERMKGEGSDLNLSFQFVIVGINIF